MSHSVRYFLVPEDDRLVPVALSTWKALDEIEDGVTLPEFAGQRVRFLRLDIEVEDRRPVEVLRAEGGWRTFTASGQFDAVALSREARAVMDLSLGAFAEAEGESIPDDAAHMKQRGRFAQARHAHEFRWEPGPELLARAEAAVLGPQSS